MYKNDKMKMGRKSLIFHNGFTNRKILAGASLRSAPLVISS